MARWWRDDRSRRIARPDDERRTYENWIRPHLGARPIAAIARADVEAWVEHLDECVLDGTIRWATAIRIWGLLTKALRDASASKVRALRARPDNPAATVRGPEHGASRASTFLYPSEFLALAEFPDVPLDRRRLYAVAIYLYPRAGELRALEWGDVDVNSGRVHIHRSEDRSGEIGRTKTENDRQFIAEPPPSCHCSARCTGSKVGRAACSPTYPSGTTWRGRSGGTSCRRAAGARTFTPTTTDGARSRSTTCGLPASPGWRCGATRRPISSSG